MGHCSMERSRLLYSDSIKYRVKWIDVEKRTFLHFRWYDAPFLVGGLSVVEPTSTEKLRLFDMIKKYVNWLKPKTLNSNIHAVARMGINTQSCLFIVCGIFIVYQSVHVLTAIQQPFQIIRWHFTDSWINFPPKKFIMQKILLWRISS